VGRGIALLFHDRGTRRGWVVSSTPRPHFTSGKDPVPILQEARWGLGPVWTGGKPRPYRDSIPDRPASSQSLYRLSYRAHSVTSHTMVNSYKSFAGNCTSIFRIWKHQSIDEAVILPQNLNLTIDMKSKIVDGVLPTQCSLNLKTLNVISWNPRSLSSSAAAQLPKRFSTFKRHGVF